MRVPPPRLEREAMAAELARVIGARLTGLKPHAKAVAVDMLDRS